MRRLQAALPIILTALIPGYAAAQMKGPTPATITNPLDVGRHGTAVATDQDADRIIGDMSSIFAQCHSQASRQGAVHVASTPSVINSNVDLAAACASSFAAEGPTPAGVVRKVRVVNAINWCSSTAPNIIGCSPTPGTCLVVIRFTASQEGILWAHEFGHTKGLPHRTDDPNAVMQPVIGPTRRNFNQGECNVLRQLGFYEFAGAPKMSKVGAMTKVPIQDFVQQTFSEGVPYAEARQYTSADLNQIIPWLSQSDKMPYWANVVTVIGIVADSRASGILRNRINAAGIGALQIDDYRSRVAAIISLGYVVNGNHDVTANNFLNTHNTPSSWSSTMWKAPYHSSDTERNNDLAAADILGLGLIGSPTATAAIAAAESDVDKSSSEAQSLLGAIEEAKRSNDAIQRNGLQKYYSKSR